MAVVEVFADVGCPFTHLGLIRFAKARTERKRDDVVLRVRSWPLELLNGVPLDPEFIGEEVDDIRRQVAPELFSGFEVAAFPASTLPAMELAALAYTVDDHVGELISFTLRSLLFELGRDVSDPLLLAQLAAEHGLGIGPGVLEAAATVDVDRAEGEQRGVIGSPHFFTPAGDFFCPALDIERDAGGHLRIDADPAAFDRFVDACLA